MPGPARNQSEIARAPDLAEDVALTPVEMNESLLRPVDGTIAGRFGEVVSGERLEGIRLAAPAGTPVVSAGDGVVRLISRGRGGGLGTIVLIGHDDGLITVYGRIDRVEVVEGDRVRRGQRIGAVAEPELDEAALHFEVRRGVGALDPEEFLSG